MISFFVCCNDLDYTSNLCNSILLSCNNVTLVGFSSKLSKDVIRLCKTKKPNVIITSRTSDIILRHFLDFNYITITISQIPELSIKKICNLLKIFSRETRYSKRVNIYNFKIHAIKVLEWMHFNPNLIGTRFILDCLAYIYDAENINLRKRDLFTFISNKYDINIFSVYWNIYTAIDEMCNTSSDFFKKIVYGTTEEINIQTVIKAFIAIY